MTISTTMNDESTVLTVPPSFDFRVMRDFRSAVDHVTRYGRSDEIVVNFAGALRVDSSALGMLLVLRDRARATGKSVVLSQAAGAVKQGLHFAGFDKLFAFRQ